MFNYDYVYCHFDRIWESQQMGKERVATAEPYKYSRETYIRHRGYAWGCGLRRSIINDHNLRFDEDLDYKEDYFFMAQYIAHISTIGEISTNAYHYRVTPNSLCMDTRKGGHDFDGTVKVLEHFISLIESERKYRESVVITGIRVLINSAWMEWDRTGYDLSVNYDLLYKCMDRFKLSYIIGSRISTHLLIKEFFLHTPFFKKKIVWKTLFRFKEIVKYKRREMLIHFINKHGKRN